ncbi:DUF1016 N-terminal domain-containing protein [Pseudoxanthomonas sp. X-1]|uniref:DUF1016 N-terminal domain-containing protein n=1 Tax=Pseudoxanthomonas sp. X-1 TaxID=2571115 RepID=UPI00110B3702|nr:DUF1016 N-terminal domain-containing protein [Pseudoxanthomonas sp. X-1]TMN25522.1 DUF1016 domain-containing protein [Pseudoxanthomonas sp. X-1]UAY76273.1 DUF1016 N-terminal domain-containing protein [Pseudoxanthomonas sp. X-1]
MSGEPLEPTPQLLRDIRQLIEQSRQQLASTVNSALTQFYWRIGQCVRTDVLQGQRAGYGECIVSALARQLEAEHGRGFFEKNLRHMLRFAEALPDEPTVSAERRQLSWTRRKAPIYIGDPLIHVAEYLTALPSKEVLHAKLHEAIALPRARLNNRIGEEA